MPRKPRDAHPGAHHIWVNATGDEPYYVDDVDRIDWLRRFVRIVRRHGWTCIAFCQMTTHVHAIVDVPDRSLPPAMKQLNMGYSRSFNERHERTGQLLRRRYGSRRITSGADLLGAYAYVVLNPVSAGLRRRAEDWRWSSFATTLGLSDDFPFVDASLVLAEVGGSAPALREFVARAADRKLAAAKAMSGV